jgi:hypothetical protein
MLKTALEQMIARAKWENEENVEPEEEDDSWML